MLQGILNTHSTILISLFFGSFWYGTLWMCRKKVLEKLNIENRILTPSRELFHYFNFCKLLNAINTFAHIFSAVVPNQLPLVDIFPGDYSHRNREGNLFTPWHVSLAVLSLHFIVGTYTTAVLATLELNGRLNHRQTQPCCQVRFSALFAVFIALQMIIKEPFSNRLEYWLFLVFLCLELSNFLKICIKNYETCINIFSVLRLIGMYVSFLLFPILEIWWRY